MRNWGMNRLSPSKITHLENAELGPKPWKSGTRTLALGYAASQKYYHCFLQPHWPGAILILISSPQMFTLTPDPAWTGPGLLNQVEHTGSVHHRGKQLSFWRKQSFENKCWSLSPLFKYRWSGHSLVARDQIREIKKIMKYLKINLTKEGKRQQRN